MNKQVVVSHQTHQDLKVAAAEAGIPLTQQAERAFRLGLLAPRLAVALATLTDRTGDYTFQGLLQEAGDADLIPTDIRAAR